MKGMRLRKKWQRDQLLNATEHEDRTLTRIENHHQNPSKDTLYSFMDSMEISSTLIFPYLKNQTLVAYELCDQIAVALDNKDIKVAEDLIEEMESMPNFEEGINLQVLISYKVQLAYMQQKDSTGIMLEVKRGMDITFPEFNENDFENYPLISEEVELVHTLALAYERMGNIQQAIKILTSIKNSLMVMPADKRSKEKRLVNVLITLTEFLVKSQDFQEAFNICEFGLDISLKWSTGKEIPHILYIKAYCLFKLGTSEHCYDLLAQSYFGYLMLYKKKQAELVRKNAYELFGISIETYGAEKLSLDWNVSYSKFDRGEVIKCNSLGQIIGILRTNAGLSQRELCQGVCNISTMSKIESGQINTNVYNLEVFMQRLGRDINMYVNTFLSKREFILKQIRNDINALLAECRWQEAEILLEQLRDEKEYKKGVNVQFVKMVEATILFRKEEKYTETYLNMSYDALKITIPKFDESMIEHYHLSLYEIMLINRVALYFCETGQSIKGIRVFERLKESMDRTYVDEIEKMNMYGVILYNYSKYLGLEGRYKEALEIIAIGEKLCVKHGKLTLLPSYAVNKACDLLELGKKEESLPYFAMAYYGCGSVRSIRDREITKKYVEDNLDIVLI